MSVQLNGNDRDRDAVPYAAVPYRIHYSFSLFYSLFEWIVERNIRCIARICRFAYMNLIFEATVSFVLFDKLQTGC